jgi:hypothetical protein
MIVKLILGLIRYAEAGPSQKLSDGSSQSPTQMRNIVANVTDMKEWVNATGNRSSRLLKTRNGCGPEQQTGQEGRPLEAIMRSGIGS